MKVFNSKLAAIGLAAFVFASCSDSTDTPNSGNGNSIVDVTTIGLTQSDAAQLASSETTTRSLHLLVLESSLVQLTQQHSTV